MSVVTLLTKIEKIEEKERFGIKPAHLEVEAQATGGPVFLEMTHDAAEQLSEMIAGILPMSQKVRLLPARQDSEGRHRIRTAIQAEGVVMPGIEGPARIRLVLEGGYGLEIPVTQETIDALYRTLRSMTTAP
jgi:hypothetical protein